MELEKNKDNQATDISDGEDITKDLFNLQITIHPINENYKYNCNLLYSKVNNILMPKKKKHSSSTRYIRLGKELNMKPDCIKTTDIRLERDLVFDTKEFKQPQLDNMIRFFDLSKPLYTKPKNLPKVSTSTGTQFKYQEYFVDCFNILIKNEKDCLGEFEGRSITGNDLSTALPGCWFNGSLINFYNAILGSEIFHFISKIDFPDMVPVTEFYIFNTFFCTTLNDILIFKSVKQEEPMFSVKSKKYSQNKNDKSDKTSCLKKFARKIKHITSKKNFDITMSNYLIIPYNEKNVHWKLFIIKNFKVCYEEVSQFTINNSKFSNLIDFQKFKLKNKMTCFCLDSYSNEVKDHKIGKALKLAFNTIIIELLKIDTKLLLKIDTKILNKSNFEVVCLKMPQQPNDYDCGPALIHNTELAILFTKKLLTENNINKTDWYNFDIMKWKREWVIKISTAIIKKTNLNVR